MRSFPNTNLAEPSASGRRQPVRQTRTNPSRNATLPGPQRGSAGIQPVQDVRQDTEIGFFPAITHFTDAISALPKEMVRHYSMLKEVDAKICGPEEAVGQLITTVLRMPAPPRKIATTGQSADASRSDVDMAPSTAGTADNVSVKSVPSRIEAASTATQENLATLELSRRQLFYRLRVYLQEMLPVLDEKNHVLSTASDCLDNQLKRCHSSYRHLDQELSEEARYGSLSHWAYTEKTTEKRGAMAGDRTRREAAAAQHLAATTPIAHEAEGAALRSELRREAMAARKHRNQHLDSDFDDTRGGSQPAGKKAQGSGKGRRAVDTNPSAHRTMTDINGTSAAPPPSKRRKVEKTASGPMTGGVPMARAMSSVYGSNTGSVRDTGPSPRATPNLEPPKKRGRGGATIPNGSGRKRAATNSSAANSPSMAASPVVGTFSTSKDIQRRSPAPSLMQRIPSSRGRQNSTQSLPQEVRNRPASSAPSKAANGNGVHAASTDPEKLASITDKSGKDAKGSAKVASNARADPMFGEDGAGDNELATAPTTGNRIEKQMKKESTDPTANDGQERPRSISISTRGCGKASKTSTPTQGSFTESQRTRPVRNVEPTKRSHKKGAGLAAQLAAAQLAHGDDGLSIHGDEDEDEGEREPRYCYCNQVSYGEMVGCDMDGCPREWFHLDCVGLTKAPRGNSKWYCEECKDTLKKKKMTED
ncbi:MAG: hypothetical protein Q9228_002119 [Teloschistes exilis]